MASTLQNPEEKAAVLLEALPYLQEFRDQTFLIKVGGSAMEDHSLVERLLRDVVFLEVVGIRPVLVHGGGKAISSAMAEAGLEPKFVGGLRATSDEAMEIVERTLSNEINQGLVEGIEKFGGKATGISGRTVFKAERMKAWSKETEEEVDLGRVGKITDAHCDKIAELLENEIVPVVSPVANEASTGLSLNVNADLAASALASNLRVSKLVYLSDVRGLLQDQSDEGSLIPSLSIQEVEPLIQDGIIGGGMIPKVRSSIEALEAGVGKVHMIDGRLSHSLLLEIFTEQGVGTEIVH